MPVDVEKLTERFLDGSLRGWMSEKAPVLLSELDRVQKLGLGVELLQARMIDAYDSIMKSDLSKDFADHLHGYPDLIVEEVRTIPKIARMMVGPCEDPNGVFSCYNPQMLRFPMQLILMSEDKDMLNHAITEFSKRNPNFEYMVVGDLAYIEYIPEEYINLLDKIPEGNWEVKKKKGKDTV